MAITMTNDLKDALLVELGLQLSGGTLVVQTSGDAEVATLTLNSGSSTALNTPSGGSTTFKSITADSSAAGGTAAKFTMYSSGTTAMYSGTVGTSGADLTIDNTTVAAGATVSAGTITVSM
jgi:hypothetical protein